MTSSRGVATRAGVRSQVQEDGGEGEARDQRASVLEGAALETLKSPATMAGWRDKEDRHPGQPQPSTKSMCSRQLLPTITVAFKTHRESLLNAYRVHGTWLDTEETEAHNNVFVDIQERNETQHKAVQ